MRVPEGSPSNLFDDIGQHGTFFFHWNVVINMLEAKVFNITDVDVRNAASSLEKLDTHGVRCPKKTV
jgi:hypothetical protein